MKKEHYNLLIGQFAFISGFALLFLSPERTWEPIALSALCFSVVIFLVLMRVKKGTG